MIKVRNQTLSRNNGELIKFEEEVTVGEYLNTIQERLKNDKYACKISTKNQYDGMANFIFFYKFGKMYLHHSSDRDDFELDDIKNMPIHCVYIKKMKPSFFYIDDKLSNREEDVRLILTYTELQIILNFIEETNDALMKYESKILQQINNKLITIYKKYEHIVVKNQEIELNIKVNLDIQQYTSLNLYLKKQISDIQHEHNTDIYWDNINIIKRIETINEKIEHICGKKTIDSYHMYTFKD